MDTCLRCGEDTADRPEGGLRHRIQLVDAPRRRRGATSLWGQLCPACWTAVRRFVAGEAGEVFEEEAVPPLRAD